MFFKSSVAYLLYVRTNLKVVDLFSSFITGTKIEQYFTVSVFIGGIKGEDESILQSNNPKLSGETHNRTRLLSCKQVGNTIMAHNK